MIEIKYLETTGMCNYKCPICVERVRNYHMKQEDFIKVVDNNIKLFNKNGVWLDFSGEPLMDPLLFERVKYLKSNGVKVRISTNGELLNEKNRKALIDSKIDYIVISVSTLDAKKYEQIRGIDNLQVVLGNTMKLKEECVAANSDIELQAVMIDTCDDFDRQQFINYFHSKGIHVAFHNFTNRADSISLNLMKENANIIHDYTLERGLCVRLSENIGILCNGEVITCCCDFMGRNSLGNIKDYNYSIDKVVNNGKLEELENNLRNHNYFGACAECTDWIYHQQYSKEKYVTVYPLVREDKG